MLIQLPWPDKNLSPNARSRSHWPKTNATKKAREDAYSTTFAAFGYYGIRDVRARFARMELIPLKVTFYPPDKRRRDEDNLAAACKASFDGIADALGVNDSKFRALYFIGEPRKPGRVEIELG